MNLDFELPVLCPFRICTGHACPGCGLTRSIGALLRGDLDLSFRYHPLGLVLAVQVIVIVAIYAMRPQLTASDLLARSQVLIWANVAVLGAVWAVRWQLGLLDFVTA